MSGEPIAPTYIKGEGKAGRMGARMMAIVADGDRGRVYLPPTEAMETIARNAKPTWVPDGSFVEDARAFTPCIYGISEWRHLFTPRQLVALTHLSDLMQEVHERAKRDAVAAGLSNENKDTVPSEASAYADAVGVYLAFALSKQADLGNSFCRWEPIAQCPRQLFGRQAIPMIWDFAEGNPLGDSSGAWVVFLNGITKAFAKSFEFVPANAKGSAQQADAGRQEISRAKVVSTDPPYYDNVPYADLSDFFYIWMRRSLKTVFPDLFATLAVPKTEELVAFSYRHGNKEKAEAFFLNGMTQAMHRLAEQAHPAVKQRHNFKFFSHYRAETQPNPVAFLRGTAP
jgi:putative DNA methylase